MPETPFIITIDTEGDNLWSRPRDITTRNAQYLPRFQSLCERFRFRPVYLVNYEMAISETFVEFGRDVLARDVGEIGMHLHAWNSPPLVPLTADDFLFQPYLVEYPVTVMKEKIRVLTALLEDTFERSMISHRAGRWRIDDRYASMLADEGYRVDCSVTPGVDWRRNLGDPRGTGGSDYRAFPHRPYLIDYADTSNPAIGRLLEVPLTIRSGPLYRNAEWAYRVPLLRRAANKLSLGLGWLAPSESDLDGMLAAAHRARAEGADHIQFMLHSSELMPGGSPSFRTESDIDQLFDRLDALFADVATWCRGMTLQEFEGEYSRRTAPQ